MDTHAEDVKKQIDDLKELINDLKAQQMTIEGTIDETTSQKLKRQEIEWSKQIEVLTIDYDRLVEARGALANAPTSPFVWDIAFVEIFSDDNRGFDIVIGNPPYVRQENIADPKLPRESVTRDNKKAYKAKLARTVYQAFPRFFGYKREKDIKPDNPSAAVSHKLGAKSDLYIYFYFHGLSLLNAKGSFCFITSNSWLDVGYGKDLQEFLLKHCHIKQIMDNEARRTFVSADVNTVICLFSAPDEKRRSGLDETARFVMFKTPFEGVLDPVIFEEVEKANERMSTEEHRIFPISQLMLLESGGDYQTPAKYSGDKWGGKYLRAPDIYWTILKKGKDKLVRLGDIAEVRRGFTTGANEFFYLDADAVERWGIEEEFLKPVITSMHEIERFVVSERHVQNRIFLCNLSKSQLRRKNANHILAYIKYGEGLKTSKKGAHTVEGILLPQASTIRNRNLWYAVPDQAGGDFVIPRLIRERFFLPLNEDSLRVGDMFFHGRLRNRETKELTVALLNSTVVYFLLEIMGRINVGGRINIYGPEIKPLSLPNPLSFSDEEAAAIVNTFNVLAHRKVLPIEQEMQAGDRRNFDRSILEPLGLAGYYEEILHAFEAHVAQRLGKETSLG